MSFVEDLLEELGLEEMTVPELLHTLEEARENDLRARIIGKLALLADTRDRLLAPELEIE